MPTKHYKYGGSTAGRTLQCPAWHKLAERLPQKPAGSSPDADRGTVLHDIMEELLNDPNKHPFDYIGHAALDYTVTEDDIYDAVEPALNAYMDFADEHNIQIELPELEVKAADEVGGTSDIIAASEDTVFIIDWKFGYNEVKAANNPQALFYAGCAFIDEKTRDLFKQRPNVCLVIIQPQANAILSAWNCSVDDVKKFWLSYSRATVIQDANNPITGDYCKFCPAQPICPAKTGAARKALMLDPDSSDAKGLGEALKLADELEDWIRAVRGLAHEQAELGLHIDGFKLVDKRATRKWKDEDAVLDKLRKARGIKLDDATDLKLKSPAQLEKLCKKLGVDFERYAAYIESVSSGTTLAKADDPRPEAINVASFAAAIAATD